MCEIENIVYDYSKLIKKMRGLGYTQKTLGEAIHMSETTMNKSLTNKRRFSQDEMEAICDVLGISRSSIDEYFFCRETLEI